MKKRNFFLKHFLTPVFIGLIVSAISFYVLQVLAAPPDSAYAPGATLNPSCAPGSANCTVTTPAISGANSDITSLTGLTTALTAGQGGTGQSTYTKGDLLVGSSTTVLAKLTVGSNGKVLMASSSASYGVSWETISDSGITSLNGQTGITQTFASSTSGADFSISSSGDVHTFYLPSASASARGLLTSTDWDTFNNKQAQLWGLSGSNLSASSTSWNVGIGTTTPSFKLDVIGDLRVNTSSTLGNVISGVWNGTAIADGYISSAGTWNAKITTSSLSSAYAPLAYNNTTGVFSLPTSTASQSGFLASADWQTFNNKSSQFWGLSGSNLFASSTSWNVGIGTTTPSHALTINGGLFVGTSTVGIPTLYVASTTGRVGIGTSTPSSLLDVAGTVHLRGFSTSTAGLYVDGSGNVGIGTTTPASLLELSQNSSTVLTLTVSTSTTSYDPYLQFRTGATPATKFVMGVDYSDSNKFKIATSTIGTNDIFVIDQSGVVDIGLGADYTLVTDTNGRVGIGTTTPSFKLDVVGDLRVNTSSTLGNVISGVWNGTAIADGYISSAGTWNAKITTSSLSSAYAPLAYNNTTGVFSLPTSTASQSGFLASADWQTFNNKSSQFWGLSGSNLSASSTSWNVGIGTTTPSQTLTVNGGLFVGTSTVGIPTLYVASTTGRVGIGTSTPGYKLSIVDGAANWVSGVAGGVYYTGTVSNTNLGFAVNNSEKMRINTDGNLGIGTTTPSEVLTVNGGLFVGTSTVGIPTLYVASTTGKVGIGTSTPGSLLDVAGIAHLRGFSTSTAGLYVDGSGNVGIGTTGPVRKLHITETSTSNYIRFEQGTSNLAGLEFYQGVDVPRAYFVWNENDDKFYWYTGGGLAANIRMIMDVTGNVGIGTTTPPTIFSISSTTPAISLVDTTATTGKQFRLRSGSAAAGAFDIFDNGSSTSRLTIDSGGNVGIGTSTPESLLHLSATAPMLYLQGTSGADYSATIRLAGETPDTLRGGYIQYDGTANVFILGVHNASDKLTASDIESIIIDRFTGNVGIGTTTPSHALTVNGGLFVGTSTTGIPTLYVASTTGRVGIGTSTPSSLLHLRGGTSGNITQLQRWETLAEGSDIHYLDLTYDPNPDTFIFSGTSGRNLAFNISGDLGIGTTTPSFKLDVIGDLRVNTSSTLGNVISGVWNGTAIGDSYISSANTWNAKITTSSLSSAYAPLAYNNTTGVFSLPTSTASQSGFLASADWQTFNNKSSQLWGLSGSNLFASSTSWNVGIGTTTPSEALTVNGGLFVGTSTVGIPTLYVASTTGRVGIGTSTPNQQLEITGNFRLPTSTTTAGIIYSGADRYIHNYGTNNFFAGVNAGNLTTTGAGNNIGIGTQALIALTTGTANNAFGYQALFQNTTGARNNAFGLQSLYLNTTGTDNVGFGQGAVFNNVSGTDNVGIGNGAIQNTTGSSNTSVGSNAGYGAVGGSFSNATILGYYAGSALTTGSNNILLGYRAGDALTSGSNNLIIGYDIDAPSATASNQLNIGNLIFSQGINGTGTTLSTGNIGIGTTTPSQTITVNGGLFVGTSTVGVPTLYVASTTGRVGIGTSTPSANFSVFGNSVFTPSSNSTSTFIIEDASGADVFQIDTTATSTLLSVQTPNWTELFVVVSSTPPAANYVYVNNANFGIGTTTPSQSLTVNGGLFVGTSTTGIPTLYVASTTGRVGIGTSTPAYALQIAGAIVPTADNLYSLGTSTLRWSNIYAASSTVGDLIFGNDFRFVEDYETPQALILKNQRGEEVMRVDENGNMVITGSLTASSTSLLALINGGGEDGGFLQNLIQNIKQALASLGLAIENGVAQLQELIVDKLMAKKVQTEELCVGDVCLNSEQLRQLLDNAGINQASPPPVEPLPSPGPADTTAPTIVLIGESVSNINVGDIYVDAGATASDDVDGDISASIAVVNSVDASVAGTYTVTYNVSDAAGNAALEVIRTVNVEIVALQPEVAPEPAPFPTP